MNKILLMIGFLLMGLAASVAAESPTITYERFQAWIEAVELPGMVFVETDDSSYDGDTEFEAIFMKNGELGLSIRLQNLENFDVFEAGTGGKLVGPYDWNGHPAKFVTQPSPSGKTGSWLLIQLTGIKATLTITGFDLSKDEIEKQASIMKPDSLGRE